MSATPAGPATVAAIHVRRSKPDDRASIESVLRATGAFSEEEVGVALELFDLSTSGRDPSYRFLCAESGAAFAGYACYGEIPLTRGSFDLYWIAVDPRRGRIGAGRALVDRMLEEIAAEGGRKVFIETSSREPYAPARAFYARAGFRPIARYADFYSAGDDKLVFERSVARSSPVSQVR